MKNSSCYVRKMQPIVRELSLKFADCGEKCSAKPDEMVGALVLLISFYIGSLSSDPDSTVDELAAYLKDTIRNAAKEGHFD